jgi:hypothetical protein
MDAATLAELQAYEDDLLARPRYGEPGRLPRFGHQVFSQHAEDGILAEIFRRIGTTSRTFFESGVGDGLENNTVYLLTQGWSGAWVEASEKSVVAIRKTLGRYVDDGRLALARAPLTTGNVDEVCRATGIRPGVDLLSLDIDRNTWWVWQAMTHLEPRVVVVEYNASWPPGVDWKVEYHADRGWNGTAYFGASLTAFERLGREKGYALVGCTVNGVNAFFVREDLCGDHFAQPFTAEHHYEPARYFLIRRNAHPPSFGD